MNQQVPNHEVHGHFHLNKGIKFISMSSNAFVVPFSVILMRIRSNHDFCQVLFLITSIITHLQLLMTSMYPMCATYWAKDPRCFNLIQIFSVFTRLLPQNLSYEAAARSCYILCLISTVSFISIFALILFYRPSSIFNSNSLPFLPTLSFFFLQILCYPMSSLTVYFWFERNQHYGFYPAVLCTICFCFCFFGSRFFEHVLHCLPNFPKLYGVRWSIPQFYIKKALSIFCFVISEAIPHIPKDWAQILCVSLVTAVFAYLMIDNFYFCDGLLIEYNILAVFTFFSGTIFHFIAIFTLFASKRPGIYATLFIILSFPIYIMSAMMCRARISHFNRIFLRAFNNSDYREIDKLPVRILLSCVGLNLPLISNDFSILDHIVEIHPNNFDVISLYAKFSALTFCHFDKLHDLLLSLKRLCNLTFPQQILLTFIEILSLQDECTYNEQKIGEMCSITSSEYVRNLNLFWTEILLGRNERLISLSTSVDNKFQTAVCLFNLLGNSRERMNHSYEQFCSISTLKVSDPVFPDRYSFFNLLYQTKYQAIIFKGQAEALQDRVFRYQPPLKSIHISAYLQKLQKTIHTLKAAIIILPLICAFIFALLGLIFTSLTYHSIVPSWDLFYHLEIVGIDIASMSSISPFLLLSGYDYINFSSISRQFLNNILFNSRMTDTRSDMIIIINRLSEMIPIVLDTFDNYNYPRILNGILNTNVRVYLTSFNGTVDRDMNFIQYLNLVAIRYGEMLRMTREQLILYYNRTQLNSLLTQNADFMINSIDKFLMNFPYEAYDQIRDEFHKTALIIEMVMLSVLVVLIVIAIVLIYLLFKSYDKLFEPLFLLPKVSISELIDKLSSRPSADQISESQENPKLSNQISYNLKQLAYERPSQAFRTRTDMKFIYYIVIIIFIVIIRLIFCPVISIVKNDFEEVFRGMKSATNGYSAQITLLKVLRDLAEFTNRHILNIVEPEDGDKLLLEGLLNLTVKLQDDLVSLSFRGSRFPKIIDKGFFFRSPNNGSTRLANFSYVDKISYLYAELYQFLHNEEENVTDQTLLQNLFNLVFSAISQQIPLLSSDIYYNAKVLLSWMVDKCLMLICFSFLISFIIYLVIRFSPTFSVRNDDFAQPLFSSIPLRSIHRFHQYLGAAESDERSRDEDPKLALTIFDKDATFQTILDPLIMINSSGKIVSMSASAYRLFNIECLPTDSFSEFLQMFSVEDIEITLPNIRDVSFTFHLNSSDPKAQIILFANLFPTHKFAFKSDEKEEKDVKHNNNTTTASIMNNDNNSNDSDNNNDSGGGSGSGSSNSGTNTNTQNGKKVTNNKVKLSDEKEADRDVVCYGCLIEDITKLSALVAQLNYEANRVRLLTVQLACNPALGTFLDLAPFYPMMLPKLAIASFLVPSASVSLDAACLTQQAIRDALNQNPSVTFFGRTTQMFRVVSGLSNTMMTTTEASKILVLFAQRLMSNIDQVQQHLKMQTFDIRCGVHLSGPYIGDIISESPPVFDLFGAPMMISQQIALSTVPKHICISRDVYEAIIDQGFNITFENEIKTIGGDDLSIHNVEY